MSIIYSLQGWMKMDRIFFIKIRRYPPQNHQAKTLSLLSDSGGFDSVISWTVDAWGFRGWMTELIAAAKNGRPSGLFRVLSIENEEDIWVLEIPESLACTAKFIVAYSFVLILYLQCLLLASKLRNDILLSQLCFIVAYDAPYQPSCSWKQVVSQRLCKGLLGNIYGNI